MKLGKIIELVNELKPNAYSEEHLTRWVTDVENYAIEGVFNRIDGRNYEYVQYEYEKDRETELLIPEPYEEVYVHYLCSKIDYWDREMEAYNNSASMYNAAYKNFAAYMRRNYRPKSLPDKKISLH